MKAFHTTTPGGPLQDVVASTPVPTGSEVLLRTIATGVCHSDVHLHDTSFDLGDGKSLPAGAPGMTLGHEIVGEVVAFGPDANGIAVGETCVVYPWIGCGVCAECVGGNEQLCNHGRVIGIQEPGGFSDHVLVPHARYLFAKGAVADTLACTYACSGLTAFSALKKLGPFVDDEHLLIIGAGGVGMNAIQIAQAVFGIHPIVIDIDDAKLAAAKDAGATHIVNSKDPDAGKKLKTLTGGGARAAIDFVGSESSSQFANRALRKGGKLIIVGLFGGTFSMPLPMIPMLARTIQGCYVGNLEDMTELMELVRQGRIPPIPVDVRDASAGAATAALDDLRKGNVAGRAVLRFQQLGQVADG